MYAGKTPISRTKQKWLFTEIEKTTTQRLYASWKRHEQKNNFDMDAKALLMQVETLTQKTLQRNMMRELISNGSGRQNLTVFHRLK